MITGLPKTVRIESEEIRRALDKPLDEIAKMAVVYQTDCVYAVNTDTAAALGITIPEEILSKATIYPSK